MPSLFAVTGYANTHDGYTVCLDCWSLYPQLVRDTMMPIFAGDEWDYAPSCDTCLTSIDVTVIDRQPNINEALAYAVRLHVTGYTDKAQSILNGVSQFVKEG
jgi:hypothetical protein